MKEQLLAILERELGATNVSDDTTLVSLGVDSLEFVSLMQCISREIKSIPERKYYALNTVGDLLQALV